MVLSKLELERLKEILFTVHSVIVNDDTGITWDLEEDIEEALKMVIGATGTTSSSSEAFDE